jgi:hypothetical protein
VSNELIAVICAVLGLAGLLGFVLYQIEKTIKHIEKERGL